MEASQDLNVRVEARREFGYARSIAPGILQAWNPPAQEPVALLKEVLAIIRPERWHETKRRAQRLRCCAFTQHRVLGRGLERGVRMRPRPGSASDVRVRYLPKRMVSWIVEEPQVAPLIHAIMDANRTGHVGDGRVFVLPVEGVVRIRTGERNAEALKAQLPFEMLWGALGTPREGARP